MVAILISGLSDSYKHFLETLQITDKLENTTFDKVCEFFANHEQAFGKKKQLEEEVLVASRCKF
jgi:hypothetical protein